MRVAMLLPLLAAVMPLAAETRGDRWWHHVEILAADDMQGRGIGTPEYDRAADYVIDRFKAAGLQPAATGGDWKQPVAFVAQRIARASASLVASDGKSTPLAVPDDMTIGVRGGPLGPHLEAPLVFAGYGLHIPEAGYDDFAGLDVRGRIVVVISGGPATISGALKSDARSNRNRWLASQGAVGVLALTSPGQIEVPWERSKLRAAQPGLYLADAAFRDTAAPFAQVAMNTASSEKLFAGSGHSFAEVAALADKARPLPRFPLALRFRAEVEATRVAVPSYNIVARLPGSDPKLAAENVVVSAHLDHLGVGGAIAGDAIYNGAMDDASGVANLIEIAAKFRADRARPKRSLLFLVVTGEEQGLLGSKAFAEQPTVPARSIVADLNFDMPLPLWRLTSVLALGAEESSLGKDAAAEAARAGLTLVPDPLPDRNVFIRSDQYSFIRTGVPALFFKFGFRLGTPEAKIEHDWRAIRYHSPSDDLKQPVEKEEAVKLNDYVAALALRVADAPTRPTWNAGSFFRRYAKE